MLRRILLASAGAMALSGAALAADIPTKAPPPVYTPPPPPPLWTGWYAGLNAGYAFGGSNSATLTTLAVTNPAVDPTGVIAGAAALSTTGVVPISNSGFIGGGQIGYNWQFANLWVAGIEADIQGAGIRGSNNRFSLVPVTVTPPLVGTGVNWDTNITVHNFVDWFGTVRGRLGFLWTPTFLVFGDGGFAYGGVRQNVQINSILDSAGNPFAAFPIASSFSNVRPGWTAGGGAEWMFMPNWSAKVEYLYYDLGRRTFTTFPSTLVVSGISAAPFFTNPIRESTRFNGHIVRAGLNYHFWTAPPPVVSKY